MSITLTPRQPLAGPVDARAILAGAWGALTPAELLARELEGPDGAFALGDAFTAAGSADGTLVIEGDASRLQWLGAGLASGTVEVRGNAGDYAGAGMSGGALVIRGSAGDFAGGGAAGRKRGMTGGELIIHGSTGASTGAAARRGLIAVGGSTGPFAGFSMIAGTIVAFGAFGPDTGLLNKRGTLVSLGSITRPSTYRPACSYAPDWLRMLFLRLRDRYGMAVSPAHLDGTYQRLSGDFAELGKGEILEWNAA
jgi:formylmethanofuran dehydrogenase subunit C